MMGVSFEVITNNARIIKYNDRACFAHLNNIITPKEAVDNIKIQSVKYKPFLTERHCSEAGCYIEEIDMYDTMSWDVASRWWTYMMSLPFIHLNLHQEPKNIVGYKAGFKVRTNIPADRMMLILFLMRMPQFQPSIVRQWDRLVRYHKANKDTAFVLALGLNNSTNMHHYAGEATAKPVESNESEEIAAYRLDAFNPVSCSESTVLYPEYTTVRSLKILLNRLVNEEPDLKLFHGKQVDFYDSSRYIREVKSKPDCLGRFFAKKGASAYRRGNFLMTVAKDILNLENIYRFSDLRYLSLGRRHINAEQMQQIISLIEN